jgi:hypothetical protein
MMMNMTVLVMITTTPIMMMMMMMMMMMTVHRCCFPNAYELKAPGIYFEADY